MLRGLFINNRKAKDSIHESGYMVYQCLQLSDKFTLDYIELDAENREIKTGYDFYFFNYHPITMQWLDTASLKKQLPNVITMILEVSPGNALVMCPEKDFDVYCALDPTIISKDNVYSFPRPLEKTRQEFSPPQNKIPVIGSFGFATRGKGFEHVVEAVNKEFDKAIIKINIPHGDFVPDSKEYSEYLTTLCKGIAKPGIDVQVTHDFMSKEDLIKWCAANDLNCFLYDRNMPGLAATTDQAIITGRPLSVSSNVTFRHITAYLPPYPKFSLRDSLEKSIPLVNKMKEDWTPENFARRFEQVISSAGINEVNKKQTGTLTLAVYQPPQPSVKNTLRSRFKKYKRKFKNLFK